MGAAGSCLGEEEGVERQLMVGLCSQKERALSRFCTGDREKVKAPVGGGREMTLAPCRGTPEAVESRAVCQGGGGQSAGGWNQ